MWGKSEIFYFQGVQQKANQPMKGESLEAEHRRYGKFSRGFD